MKKAFLFAICVIVLSIGIYIDRAQAQEGIASWYGSELHGNRTASGERFDMNAFTAAHRSLPFGTMVLVTNARNGQSILVRINDRGPFHDNRVIDVSLAAAARLGMVRSGTTPVVLEVQN